ncbi:unnamed protein product [Moneuplotes crassus]|uniref:Uncharacterized protein n=1 Tax=Euplotes crassus TaxID=5936 RepID=A0AAD1Y8Z6_EUPCR|nr:unnamed protein product [Moneuplotes crassus]
MDLYDPWGLRKIVMSIPLNARGEDMDINIEHPCQVFAILLKHDILGRMLFLCYMKFNNRLSNKTTSEKLLQSLFDALTASTKLMLQRQQFEYKYGIRKAHRNKIRYSEDDKKELITALKNIMKVYNFPSDMLEERASYAIKMILTAMKEILVRDSYHILNPANSKLKGSKLDKTIVQEMDYYFCDADNAVSCCYKFEMVKKKKLLQFTRMTPYVVDFVETTTDFYTNFRNSVIAQVAESIKKEGKLKDKDNVEENLKLKITHYPQMVILSAIPTDEDNFLFKLVPDEFDLSRVNSSPDEEEKKEEENFAGTVDDIGVGSTIYELRNIITVNKRNKFFDMVNRDDGEWSGYAQGNNFDNQTSSFLEYKAPEEGSRVYPIEEAHKMPHLTMNNFFVELNPVIVIFMKKDPFEHTKKKFVSTEEDHMNFYNNDEKEMFENDLEMAKKLQEQLDEEERNKYKTNKKSDVKMSRLSWKCKFCYKRQETFTSCSDCGRQKSVCKKNSDSEDSDEGMRADLPSSTGMSNRKFF